MKLLTKVFVLFAVLLFLGSGISFAQEQTQHFSRTFYILRIAPHQMGYRVIYQTEAGLPFETFMPINWFVEAGGKASIQRRWDRSAPFMQVFWQNGELSHFRLVLAPTFDHPSWGTFPQGIDPVAVFNVDTLQLHY
jgi:hypothetical protein